MCFSPKYIGNDWQDSEHQVSSEPEECLLPCRLPAALHWNNAVSCANGAQLKRNLPF